VCADQLDTWAMNSTDRPRPKSRPMRRQAAVAQHTRTHRRGAAADAVGVTGRASASAIARCGCSAGDRRPHGPRQRHSPTSMPPRTGGTTSDTATGP
jgi:hypothetical protein